MATLAELKTRLATLETQLDNATTQEYNIVGSHSVKYADIDKIEKQIGLLKKRIFRFQGYTGRTSPDFSTGSSKETKDYA